MKFDGLDQVIYDVYVEIYVFDSIIDPEIVEPRKDRLYYEGLFNEMSEEMIETILWYYVRKIDVNDEPVMIIYLSKEL